MRSVIIGRKSPNPSVAARESCADLRPRWRRVGNPWIPQPAERPGGSRRTAPRERTKVRPVSHSLGTGKSRSARPAKRVCASSVSPAFGGPTETKKARHRRCFKPPFKTLATTGTCEFGQVAMYALRLENARKNWTAVRPADKRKVVEKKEGAARAAPPIAPRSEYSVKSLVQSLRCPMALQLTKPSTSPGRASRCHRLVAGVFLRGCARPATL